MQIHENLRNREGCLSRVSTKGDSPIDKSKKTENSPQSYLSVSSCSYQQGTGTIDSIMSGESLFKVFNFEPTNNFQDSEKCACFWEHLKKYTNIKPVDCSLVKDTRELKKKKTQTVKSHKQETISLNSPDFPWEQLYEELRKRKINFNIGAAKKCGASFNEYEIDETPDNLVLLSFWKPKSCKKVVEEEKPKPINYGDEQITPICSFIEEEQTTYDILHDYIYPISPSRQAANREVVDDNKLQVPLSSQSETMEQQDVNISQSLKQFRDDILPCPIPESSLNIPVTLDKCTDTDSLEKQVQIIDKKCVMCGFLNCKCKAGKADVEEMSESSVSTAEMTKHEQIKLIAKDTIVKIFDFSNKSTLNDNSGYKCAQTVEEEKLKPLIESKKIIPDPVPKLDDGMIVIKPIDDLKISSSTESSTENPQ